MLQKLNLRIVPLAEAPAPDITEKRHPVVLVVDDERVIADTLAVILSNNGFAPLTAYDGESALEIATVIPPDLLISDVVMPGMTGIELAIAVVDRVPDCKVLLFSGQAATADLLAEARAAGRDFTTLMKPIHPTDLLARVTGCLKDQQPINRRPINGGAHARVCKAAAGDEDANFRRWQETSFL